MRTTLTLDEDVAAKVKVEMRRSGRPFKETVNRLLRLALNARRAAPKGPEFRVPVWDMVRRPGVDLDNIGELIEQLEGPAHR